MGGGSFSMRYYHDTSKTLQSKSSREIFESKVHEPFRPHAEMIREVVASEEHPFPTPIAIGLDVTGSMGQIAVEIAKHGLGKIMERVLDNKHIQSPQIMFAAIGDGIPGNDKEPLQVTQFESDNRMMEQLQKLWLEGKGGGNDYESYTLLHYFMLFNTRLANIQQGRKGFIFTIGDEPTAPYMLDGEVRWDHGKAYYRMFPEDRQISNQKIVDKLSEHFEIFHLQITQGGHSNYPNARPTWTKLLGQRVVPVNNYNDIPEIISLLIELQLASAENTPAQIFERYGHAACQAVRAAKGE